MKIKSVEAYWAHSRSLGPPSPAGFIVEYWLGANPLLHDLVEESFPVEDGLIAVLDRPGLGITVRQDFLKQHTGGSGEKS
jgi:L-alanine-DL-glutamate epimerase-like enolase superfamily enzyme